MEFPDLHLAEVNFTAPPTKSQIVNTLRDITKFLQSVGGSVLHDGSYTIGGEEIGQLLNATLQLRVAADKFEGPSGSGLAVPQLQGQPGPRRM